MQPFHTASRKAQWSSRALLPRLLCIKKLFALKRCCACFCRAAHSCDPETERRHEVERMPGLTLARKQILKPSVVGTWCAVQVHHRADHHVHAHRESLVLCLCCCLVVSPYSRPSLMVESCLMACTRVH